MARRLICPKCAAQYEIGDGLIPAEGREVECSSCGHVWKEPGQTGDPPRLHRPLNESILSILREEAEREIAARRAEDGREPEAPAAAPEVGDEPGEAAPVAEAPSQSGEPALLAPAPLVPTPQDNPQANADTAAPEEEPEPADTLPKEAPAEAVASDPAPALSPEEPAGATRASALPDADRLAATLIAPERAPVAPLDTPDDTRPPSPRAARLGFRTALAIAAVLLALYLAAPHLGDQGRAGAVVAQWRTEADQARLWLAQEAAALASWGRGLLR